MNVLHRSQSTNNLRTHIKSHFEAEDDVLGKGDKGGRVSQKEQDEAISWMDGCSKADYSSTNNLHSHLQIHKEFVAKGGNEGGRATQKQIDRASSCCFVGLVDVEIGKSLEDKPSQQTESASVESQFRQF
ncbi:hypothetical protein BO86DRAFT_376434 [Aspergillus japonicus CBS 114.51]|uniref:Uncharacterized protein n=1 Tax=Aspergillus japonicus CBS 114.51 TaxID=1448312 RepID=A0A8T8XBQ1_ASPJA|nr:hypothetical protein BO86DRAFT_376434 [Aspergillus japonicus CBS 114.51]RAH85430.1 hypothetical protein BO86DRAFT_376434 [Aspergillus japonicus CBS 114.51]